VSEECIDKIKQLFVPLLINR